MKSPTDLETAPFARLQIGMSRPGAIPDEVLQVFFDSTWINLGDAPQEASRPSIQAPAKSPTFKETLKRALRSFNASYDQLLTRREEASIARQKKVQEMERSACFRPFWWSVDGKLDFADNAFSFIFSEHFFEHIWPDEAYALFLECIRVLKPGGVLRISVPDADLRTYEAPEPFAFDTATFATSTRGWGHPEVHKMRWNIYLLTQLLSLAGFRVRPIAYCDKDGQYVHEWPQRDDREYPENADWEVIASNAYLIRKRHSLIVDAVKTGAA